MPFFYKYSKHGLTAASASIITIKIFRTQNTCYLVLLVAFVIKFYSLDKVKT